jgi:uncharacterized protein (TIGR02001 family)
MSKFNRLAAVAAVLAMTAAPSFAADLGGSGSMKDAPAAPASPFTYSFAFGGTTDYVFRGVSQTAANPAFQTSFDMNYGIFYAGAWGSGIDFGPSPAPNVTAEIDFYAGVKPTLGKLTFDLGVIWYAYPGVHNNPTNVDYVELKGGVSTEIVKNLTIGGTLFWTPDNTGETGQVWTFEGAAAYQFAAIGPVTPTLSGLVGTANATEQHNVFNGVADSYTYWNIGLALAVDKYTFDFRYWDTDLPGHACNGPAFQCSERFVFSAKIALP